MEYGPGSRKIEASPCTLGKRGIQDAEIEVDTEANSIMRKRGRRSEVLQMDETAGVQEHPCLEK